MKLSASTVAFINWRGRRCLQTVVRYVSLSFLHFNRFFINKNGRKILTIPLFKFLFILQNAWGGDSPLLVRMTQISVTTSSLHGILEGALRYVTNVLAPELLTLATRLPGVMSTISESGIMRSLPSYMTLHRTIQNNYFNILVSSNIPYILRFVICILPMYITEVQRLTVQSVKSVTTCNICIFKSNTKNRLKWGKKCNTYLTHVCRQP